MHQAIKSSPYAILVLGVQIERTEVVWDMSWMLLGFPMLMHAVSTGLILNNVCGTDCRGGWEESPLWLEMARKKKTDNEHTRSFLRACVAFGGVQRAYLYLDGDDARTVGDREWKFDF